MNILLDLFLTFAKIGLFTFGGGYAMLPMLENEIVMKNKWATMEEIMDYFAISQCTPGVIAVNVATFIGYKDMTKEFVLNPMDDENLPEKKDTEIDLGDGSKWTYPVSEGVISLQTTRDTNYEVYIMVQNELSRAFNEVREQVSMQKFGHSFADLNEDQRSAVTKAVPQKISEAEPRQGAKKK